MNQVRFDEDTLAHLEVLYRTRDVLRRRRLVREALGAAGGDRILDAGCGPGFFVAELLEEVGPEGFVVGVDASPPMLAAAAQRCADRPNVAFHEADVASLPVEDASVDRALCVQVLEYVADPTAALAELHRAVRPGGRVVVWDVDWSTASVHSSDPVRTERIMRVWDEHLTHPSLPRTLAARLRAAGFADVRVEGHSFATTELVPDAFCGADLPLLEEFVAGRGGLEEEVRAWDADLRALDERGEFFFAVVQFCFAATRR